VSADHAAACVVDGLDVQVAPGEEVAVGAARAVKACAHFAVDRRPANRTNFVGKEAVEQFDIVDLVGDALIKIIFSIKIIYTKKSRLKCWFFKWTVQFD